MVNFVSTYTILQRIMKKSIVFFFVLFLSSFFFPVLAQENDGIVLFSSTPAEGVAFNNIGVGGAMLSFSNSEDNNLNYIGLNANYYHKHSWWTILGSASAGKALSGDSDNSGTAFNIGAYAGIDLARSPKLAIELYPVGILAHKSGISDSFGISLGGAARLSVYFTYNMAIFVGAEMSYGGSLTVSNLGVMLSL